MTGLQACDEVKTTAMQVDEKARTVRVKVRVMDGIEGQDLGQGQSGSQSHG